MFLLDIIVFRLFAYLLNMICFNFLLLYKISYVQISVRFGTVLYQFLKTGTSDICLMCIVHLLRFSCFILYPLHFSFTVPLKSQFTIIFTLLQMFLYKLQILKKHCLQFFQGNFCQLRPTISLNFFGLYEFPHVQFSFLGVHWIDKNKEKNRH